MKRSAPCPWRRWRFAVAALAIALAQPAAVTPLAAQLAVEQFPIRPRFNPLVEIRARSLWGAEPRARSETPRPRLKVLAIFARAEDVADLERLGIVASAVVGRVASLSLDHEQLERLSDLPSVVAVEVPPPMTTQMNVNAVENGASAARAAGRTGRGVLVAILDTGIDIHHQDFRLPNGDTRIKFLWDQFDQSYQNSGGQIGSPPPPREGETLGTVYTEQQINMALRGSATVRSVDLQGHGTAVAGAAVGNGRATGNGQPAGVYVGVAQAAELLVVRVGGSTKTSGRIDGDTIHALQWVGERADELGMPVVVNMSFGGHGGPHDGTDPLAIASEDFVNVPGRVVVVGAGNDGAIPMHASGVSRNPRATGFSRGADQPRWR